MSREESNRNGLAFQFGFVSLAPNEDIVGLIIVSVVKRLHNHHR